MKMKVAACFASVSIAVVAMAKEGLERNIPYAEPARCTLYVKWPVVTDWGQVPRDRPFYGHFALLEVDQPTI